MSRPSQKETSQLPAFRLTVERQMADYKRRLAERMKSEREARSLSRDALALRSDVSGKTIKRIELQQVDNPRPVTIRRLAKALDLDPSELRPPPEMEADQLNRLEEKLDEILKRLSSTAPLADEDGPDATGQGAADDLGPLPGDDADGAEPDEGEATGS